MNEKNSVSNLIAKWHRNYKVGRDKPKVWFFDDPSFNYIQVTKVASTSIKHTLSVYAHQKYAGGRAEEVTHEVVKQYAKKYAKHGDLESLFPEKPEFVFAFVRNPLDRLLSSYTDKVLKAHKQGKGKCIFWNHGINLDMNFEQFVNRVVDIPDAKIGIILVGSGQTRQFIQRLGRILRRSPEKKKAKLYEIISSDTLEENIARRRKEAL